jgi:hypothetical protein
MHLLRRKILQLALLHLQLRRLVVVAVAMLLLQPRLVLEEMGAALEA